MNTDKMIAIADNDDDNDNDNDHDNDDDNDQVPHLSALLQVGGAPHCARPAGGRGGAGAGALAVQRDQPLPAPHHQGRGHHASPPLHCPGLSG